jgi:hypothetical protein
MHLKSNPPALVLSASALSSFVGCRHRTALALGVAVGELANPSVEGIGQSVSWWRLVTVRTTESMPTIRTQARSTFKGL